jgi:hypothetical protein
VCQLASREYDFDRPTVRLLTEAWPLPFHDYAPVRALPSYKGQKNFTGLLWCATNSRHVGCESWLERDRLTSLDHDTAVIGIDSPPFRLAFALNAGRCSHVPDYFVKQGDGPCMVIDIRPGDRISVHDISVHDRDVFSATATHFKSVGWGYQRVGALPLNLAANLHWLSGYKHPRCLNPTYARKIFELLGEWPLELRSVARTVGHPVSVLPALFHLLWAAGLAADLQPRSLSRGSELTLGTTSCIGDRVEFSQRGGPDISSAAGQSRIVQNAAMKPPGRDDTRFSSLHAHLTHPSRDDL